jgi:hypothetical protein
LTADAGPFASQAPSFFVLRPISRKICAHHLVVSGNVVFCPQLSHLLSAEAADKSAAKISALSAARRHTINITRSAASSTFSEMPAHPARGELGPTTPVARH